MSVQPVNMLERIEKLERWISEAHSALCELQWEARKPPTRWMFEVEKYFASDLRFKDVSH